MSIARKIRRNQEKENNRQLFKPSAVLSSQDKQGLKALADSLTPQEKAIMTGVWQHPKVQILIGAAEAERQKQELYGQMKDAFAANLEFERMVQRIARRCDKIDDAVRYLPDTQKLHDALSGGLRDAIQYDYDDIVEAWGIVREFMLKTNQGDLGEFGTTHQAGLKKMVEARLAALDALAGDPDNGIAPDDTLIRALPPLDHDIDKLLNPVTKSGRNSVKDDLLTTTAHQLKKDDPHISPLKIVRELRAKWKNTTDPDEAAALALITRDDLKDPGERDEAAKDLIKKRLRRV